MYTNRVRAILDAMTKNETVDDEVETTPEAEPKNVFAKNLIDFMGFAGMRIKHLAEATGIEPDRIRNLRSAGIPSIGKARKPDELKLIANALGVTVRQLFEERTPPETPPERPQGNIEEMVSKGLSGPKKSFLMDAIEMAYIAALASKSNY
jgi:transcriptional regulator with XRE-family HTH domain